MLMGIWVKFCKRAISVMSVLSNKKGIDVHVIWNTNLSLHPGLRSDLLPRYVTSVHQDCDAAGEDAVIVSTGFILQSEKPRATVVWSVVLPKVSAVEWSDDICPGLSARRQLACLSGLFLWVDRRAGQNVHLLWVVVLSTHLHPSVLKAFQLMRARIQGEKNDEKISTVIDKRYRFWGRTRTIITFSLRRRAYCYFLDRV